MDEAMLLHAVLERICAISDAVTALDPDDPAALDALLHEVERSAEELTGAASVSLEIGAFPPPPSTGDTAHRDTSSFPLRVGGQSVGSLTVVLRSPRALSDPERLLLENLANLSAIAISQAGARRDSRRTLARKEDELELLRRAGLLISSRTGLQDTLDTILQMALEVTKARYGIFRLVDLKRNALVMAAIAGDNLGRPAVEALPINATSVMGMVAKTKAPVLITDVRELPWAKIYYPLDHGLQMRSELAVPLIGAGGRLVGVLNLESPEIAAFGDADSHLLQSLASQAVIAIQQVRLLDALRETSTRVLTQDVEQVREHLRAVHDELVSGDAEWDRKVEAILAEYERLADENLSRQEALRAAREAHAVAETFAAMGDIAANMLHHLNNQVGTIPVRVEGIQDKCAPLLAQSPYLAANLAEIERAAFDALQTMRERLDLLRPITLAPVSVAECLADALAVARLPAAVRVTQDPELRELPPVLASREGLTLVLQNLLDNAAEALGGTGKIDVCGAAESGHVLLTIADNGPGIPANIQPRIFDLNFSGRKRGGRDRLGFGLWWVKTLITRLGGAVTVESDGRSGTTFRLRLPHGAWGQ